MAATRGRSSRSRSTAGLALLALSAWRLILPKAAPAQTFEVLHAFVAMPSRPLRSIIRGSDGSFFGTAPNGGDSDLGVVFKVTPGGTFTILHSFSGPDGQNPTASLVQGSDGNFYGTTPQGSVTARGTIYKVTPAGVFTTIHTFVPGEGRSPDAGLVEGNDGNFYGVTTWGGASDLGTFFRVTPTGTLTTLYSFSGGDGQQPVSAFVKGADGNFYGTVAWGSPGTAGWVVRFTPAGTRTDLHTFTGGSDGKFPMARLVLASDGYFYGTTNQGGLPVGAGTVFRISSLGSFQTLYSFAGPEGQFPFSELVEGPVGVLYGTTLYGGSAGEGTIFQITFAGTRTTLHSFAGPEGRSTYAGLVDGLDGKFYGVCPAGGTADWGSVYSMTPAGAVAVVHDFGGGEGQSPEGALAFGPDGALYGLTAVGGAEGLGAFFRLTTGGTYATQYSFTVAGDGAAPLPGLALGNDGNLYGTTGANKLFRVTPSGSLTTLHAFSTGEGLGASPLLKGSDGNFYGVASGGGANGMGTVFQATPAGTVTPLYSFSGSDGSGPTAPLLEGPGGFLYGTTDGGGANDLGTVFSIPMAGSLATLASFAAPDGGSPYGLLALGNDGNFYGTTSSGGTGGGTFGFGSVFRVTPAGTLMTLYSFTLNGPDGNSARGGLIKGTDGKFYGTTASGNPSGNGAVYSVTQDGQVTPLHSFSGPDGAGSVSPLVQGPDGALYGVTQFGGPKGGGVVFRVTVPSAASAVVSGDATICLGDVATIQADLTGTPPWSLTWSDGFAQSGVTTSPATRPVSPLSTTAYTLTAFSDVVGPGTFSGSATVTVNPVPALPVITAPAAVLPGATGVPASASSHPGSSYLWSIGNGVINTGQGTDQITFTAGGAGEVSLWVTETNAAGCTSPVARRDVVIGDASPAGLVEDAHATGGTSSNVNLVLEPGETVLVNPSWTNIGSSPLPLTGTASDFTGPAGATYTFLDTAADYGTIAPGATADSFTAGGPSYRLSVSNPSSRPNVHWDATFLETLGNGATRTWTLHLGDSFSDVPAGHIAYPYVENILHNGITNGCGAGLFCPDDFLPRWQAAILLARALLGPGVPIPTSGTVGPSPYDCAGGGTSLFTDVAPTDVACPGIHFIYSQQVTTGCGPGLFCPDDFTPRWQAAVFLTRALLGPGVPVPASGTVPGVGPYSCTGGGTSLFSDVAPTDVGCPYIHYIYSQGITQGFGNGTFGPDDLAPRWQMAILLVKAFHIPFLH